MLPQRFFDRSAEVVARDLIGAIVVSSIGGRAVGRIVETEAYLGCDDPASHAFAGRKYPGNVSIYGPPGSWYVYRSYGIHWCANLVTGPRSLGAAVLLRAVEVLEGIALVRARRGPAGARRLADGPGKLCQAFGIDRSNLDGRLMRGSPVELRSGVAPSDVVVTARIGITRAIDWPLRFLAA